MPAEELELTPSEVHYIQQHTIEDRRMARQHDQQIRRLEMQVYHLNIAIRWLLGIVSAGFVGLLLKGAA